MHRPLITCILGLLACEACASEPRSTLPNPIDVSGDDCTASVLVYDKPPPEADKPFSELTEADWGTAFINDGCAGDRIFLGIDGARRELKRSEERPLGEGGVYSDGEYRVLVKRGRMLRREELCPPGAECHAPERREYDVMYEAQVRIWSRSGSWSIDGTLLDVEYVWGDTRN
jgi:hypothetical protein